MTETCAPMEQYKNEVKLRRKYFNMVPQLKGNIRPCAAVGCR
jgi:hypothetical protein